MKKGYLSIILHAHLPFVRHPEYDSFFEENWLFEAITECYLPLLNVLERLEKDRINYQLTLSLSPTLISMLSDALLQSRYLEFLHRQIELAEKEIIRTRSQPEYQKLARLYRRFFVKSCSDYQDRYQGDLLKQFKRHHSLGNLELITTAATHGYLPLLNTSETAVRNQINVGIDTFKTHFGFAPTCFWLPECGYYPGLEDPLKEAGITYFFVDSHSLSSSDHSIKQTVYSAHSLNNGISVFGRDPASSKQVWSAQEGYPGDFAYREYYRDIGFDLDLEYLGPYILDGITRIQTGIKYFRITGKDNEKELYDPKQALNQAYCHAQHFIQQKQEQIDALTDETATPPIIVAPFDAELFGHWWFEGPYWLEQVLRLADHPAYGLKTISCQPYLEQFPASHDITPKASSWGEHGYSEYWINETNDWIYPFLSKAQAQMERLACDLSRLTVDNLQERTLNQAARSVLLAQASDWPFIMKSGTAVEYANKRITDHLARFNYLHDSIRKNRIDERYLIALETMDNLFPNINFRTFCPKKNNTTPY
ncbi:MAG: DUF1957 domain-containing protein [Methylicorpusculum sp.]|nr:DUF1957 domain-containing protein [Methylicorpusculum sp.]